MISLNVDELIKRTQNPDLNKVNRLVARRKLQVLVRDQYECQKCGGKENLTIDRYIDYKEEAGRKKSARHYQVDKCRTLCVQCHISVEQLRDKNERNSKRWLRK